MLEYRLSDNSKAQMPYVSTPFFKQYDCEAEHMLSSPDISLGAIISLPRTDNPNFLIHSAAFGDKSTWAWIYVHLARLNAASGASNSMDAESLMLCARDIADNYPYLTLGEFCVFCSRFRAHRYAAKRSDYVFSSDTIMQGMREYMHDRREAIAKWEREHQPQVDTSRCITYEQAVSMGLIKNDFRKSLTSKFKSKRNG